MMPEVPAYSHTTKGWSFPMKHTSALLALLALGALSLSLPQVAVAQAQVTAAPSLMNFQGHLAKPDHMRTHSSGAGASGAGELGG